MWGLKLIHVSQRATGLMYATSQKLCARFAIVVFSCGQVMTDPANIVRS